MPLSCTDSYYMQLVYEYLLHMGLDRTASLFVEESKQCSYNPPNPVDGLNRNTITQLIQLFDDEDEKKFFNVFRTAIPHGTEKKKMVLELLAYFACTKLLKDSENKDCLEMKPLVHAPPRLAQHLEAGPPSPSRSKSDEKGILRSHSYYRTNCETLEHSDVLVDCHDCKPRRSASQIASSSPNRNKREMIKSSGYVMDTPRRIRDPAYPCMCSLLDYLESECQDLRKDPHFSKYFNLPYVVRPQCHPNYNNFFQESWVSETRRKLWNFLINHRQAANVPELVLRISTDEVPFSVSCNSSYEHQNENLLEKDVNCGKASDKQCDHFAADLTKFVQSNESKISHKGTKLSSKEFCSHYSCGSALNCSSGCDKKRHSQQSFENQNGDGDAFTSEVGSVDLLAPHSHLSEPGVHPPSFSTCAENIPDIATRPVSLKTDESTSDEGRAKEVEDSAHHLKSRYNQLHSDYHNLIGVAAELTGALERSLKGQHVDLRETLNNCSQIFPELFQQRPNQNLGQDAAVPQDHKKFEQPKSSVYDPTLNGCFSGCKQLNMIKVKKHLTTGSVKNRLLLLQALRWRITRRGREERDLTVNNYIQHDIFNLQGDPILKNLLAPCRVETPHPLQQAAARLLNAIASLRSGREYIARNSSTVKIVSRVLKQENGISVDPITSNMLVAALQKLSLRRSQRIAMIESGLVEWLVKRLSSADYQNAYSVEYTSALLMNLCLHTSAKQRCVAVGDTVLKLLVTLMATPVTQALPYINGILYSLLTHPELNQLASNQGLGPALENHIALQPNIVIRRQLEHILCFHRNQLLISENVIPKSDGELIDDDNEEIDLLEDEMELDDPVQSISGELSGEDLLRTHYSPQNNIAENCNLSAELESVLTRPTTPLRRQSTPGLMSDDSEGVVVAENHKKSYERTRSSGLKNSSSMQGFHEQQLSSNIPAASKITGRNGISGKDLNQEKKREKTSMEKISRSKSENIIELRKQYKLPEIIVLPAAGQVAENEEPAPESSEKCSSCVDVDRPTILESNRQIPNNAEVTQPENGDAAAFAPRPRIPRTPPRYQ